jgi:hypothetical protein
MGEPFLNFEHVLASTRRLPDLGITPRRTTISTVGWMPGLRRFVDEVEQPLCLALSLHAANPERRSELMPVNERYPLDEVLAECRRYFDLRRRKVFVEVRDCSPASTTRPVMHQGARRAARRQAIQGQSHPLQPDGHLRRLLAGDDRALQGRSRTRAHPRDGAPHARPRHRGRLRPACGRHGAVS